MSSHNLWQYTPINRILRRIQPPGTPKWTIHTHTRKKCIIAGVFTMLMLDQIGAENTAINPFLLI